MAIVPAVVPMAVPPLTVLTLIDVTPATGPLKAALPVTTRLPALVMLVKEASPVIVKSVPVSPPACSQAHAGSRQSGAGVKGYRRPGLSADGDDRAGDSGGG